MKNYYDILGLSPFEGSQEAILSAYKSGTSKLRESVYDKANIAQQLISLNEAYLVLLDELLKERYDHALRTSQTDKDLENALLAKYSKAKDFITGKLATVPKRKKSKWPAIICGFFLLSGFGQIIIGVLKPVLISSDATSQTLEQYLPSSEWKRYELSDAFNISIPNSMELRKENDPYTQILNSDVLSNAEAVFQQKDLSMMSSEALDTYCRILIQHYGVPSGEVGHHNQAPYITQEDRDSLKEMVDAEVEPYSYVTQPSFQWIDVAGTKALEATYKRTGVNGPVNCHLYLLMNYDEVVKIVIAYRERDSDYWKTDMENVIRTFKWNVLK